MNLTAAGSASISCIYLGPTRGAFWPAPEARGVRGWLAVLHRLAAAAGRHARAVIPIWIARAPAAGLAELVALGLVFFVFPRIAFARRDVQAP